MMTVTEQGMIAFGPVPSRRLGRSLGINNIPPKSCSYSCVYCQVGPTRHQEIIPRVFYDPASVVQAVTQRIDAARQRGENIDYVTFVPDGEPTLDINLGTIIDLLRPLEIKIAIISNASLIWRSDVSQVLSKADWVSVKVDTVDEATWRTINQPHHELRFATILQGIQHFAATYQGMLCTETMLVAGINDTAEHMQGVADFLQTINPHNVYLAAPIRPPADATIRIPGENTIVQAYEILHSQLTNVQYLIGYEGDDFSSTGDPARDLLAITAVHPMREEAVRQFLARANLDWSLVEELLQTGELTEVSFAGRRFYMRRVATGK
jgi:wyosine [tRNA(Phe)-imidazoG37] synthetase (radical SAM superfamily)